MSRIGGDLKTIIEKMLCKPLSSLVVTAVYFCHLDSINSSSVKELT